jgi:iron(III) transport system permease protein
MTETTPRPEVKDAAFGRALPEGFPNDEAAPKGGRRAFDPIVIAATVIAVGFVLIAIVYPVGSVVREALSAEAIPVFERYILTVQNRIFVNTMVLGLAVATLGTFIAFVFAYVQVRVPAPRPVKLLIHIMALLPIVSPPFALAVATISLFGRSGIITRDLLGLRIDIYSWPDVTIPFTPIQMPPFALTAVMALYSCVHNREFTWKEIQKA